MAITVGMIGKALCWTSRPLIVTVYLHDIMVSRLLSSRKTKVMVIKGLGYVVHLHDIMYVSAAQMQKDLSNSYKGYRY